MAYAKVVTTKCYHYSTSQKIAYISLLSIIKKKKKKKKEGGVDVELANI